MRVPFLDIPPEPAPLGGLGGIGVMELLLLLGCCGLGVLVVGGGIGLAVFLRKKKG